MRPASGRASPAIACSAVLLPVPDGPNRIVMPGGTWMSRSSTKAASPPAARRASRIATWRAGRSDPGDTAAPVEAVHRPKGAEGGRGEDRDHAVGLRVLVRDDPVVDVERGGLRLARDVAGDHDGHAELAER